VICEKGLAERGGPEKKGGGLCSKPFPVQFNDEEISYGKKGGLLNRKPNFSQEGMSHESRGETGRGEISRKKLFSKKSPAF